MSNSLAIAAVTRTLGILLQAEIPRLDTTLSDLEVTTQPLDKARSGITKAQLNLFLYHTAQNGAWRNMDMPHQVKSGETGRPPLALDLYYLLTAYGRGESDNEALSHRVLGGAMNILHDYPVLGSDEINQILLLPESGLREQVERVRITPQPLSLDEMSKLWTTFQTQYRISTAYQVSVVLIESKHSAKTPLPVLTRGKPDPATKRDQGIISQPDLTSPFPTLEEVLVPNKQPSALLGDVLTLGGHHLDGTSVVVEIKHPRLPDAIVLIPEPGGTATRLKVKIPDQPNDLRTGFYTVTVKIIRSGESFSRTTNEQVFSLAPQIEANPPIGVVRSLGNVTISLACKPKILPEQRASLLLGDREILAEQHSSPTTTLTFVAETDRVPLLAGQYFVRLRVDGVDSLLIDRTLTPPIFDPTQQVTIP